MRWISDALSVWQTMVAARDRERVATMMRWFQALLPHEDRFFPLFERHSRILVAGAAALQKLLEGGASVPDCCRVIAERESEADTVAREVLLSVRRTFITPFDRSDIKDLIQSMDDAIDQMHQTAKTITRFEVRSFDPLMREMADLAVDAARLTAVAVPYLRKIATHASDINAYAEQITHLEERADQLHDDGLKALFRQHGQSGAMAYIVGAQIYDSLEKVVDRFEDVANEINGIVIEHI